MPASSTPLLPHRPAAPGLERGVSLCLNGLKGVPSVPNSSDGASMGKVDWVRRQLLFATVLGLGVLAILLLLHRVMQLQEIAAHGAARLFALADHALYEAKRTGRGRIVVVQAETVTGP